MYNIYIYIHIDSSCYLKLRASDLQRQGQLRLLQEFHLPRRQTKRGQKNMKFHRNMGKTKLVYHRKHCQRKAKYRFFLSKDFFLVKYPTFFFCEGLALFILAFTNKFPTWQQRFWGDGIASIFRDFGRPRPWSAHAGSRVPLKPWRVQADVTNDQKCQQTRQMDSKTWKLFINILCEIYSDSTWCCKR